MREHGVPLSDEDAVQGAISIEVGSDVEMDEFREAEEACRHLIEDVEPPGDVGQISEEQQQAALERMLEFAQCMREQGIDFPDPEWDANGMIRFGPDQDVDIEDSEFRAAEASCRHLLPEFGPNDGPGEGS